MLSQALSGSLSITWTMSLSLSLLLEHMGTVGRIWGAILTVIVAVKETERDKYTGVRVTQFRMERLLHTGRVGRRSAHAARAGPALGVPPARAAAPSGSGSGFGCAAPARTSVAAEW